MGEWAGVPIRTALLSTSTPPHFACIYLTDIVGVLIFST